MDGARAEDKRVAKQKNYSSQSIVLLKKESFMLDVLLSKIYVTIPT